MANILYGKLFIKYFNDCVIKANFTDMQPITITISIYQYLEYRCIHKVLSQNYNYNPKNTLSEIIYVSVSSLWLVFSERNVI